LTFCLVTAVASLPGLLLTNLGHSRGLIVAGAFVSDMMRRLSQAMLVHGAFQELRGKPVSLLQSLQVGWQRILPVIGLAICASILTALGFIVLIVPGLIVATMLFVATPVCVVERLELDPFSSMERSAQLTKGHRWKIFGLLVLVAIPTALVGEVLDSLAEIAGAASVLALISQVIGNAISEAVFAVLVIATYHDLRVAQEGIDTEEIAAVFE
jgi:branched-subunit amino acid transport protein AzlD